MERDGPASSPGSEHSIDHVPRHESQEELRTPFWAEVRIWGALAVSSAVAAIVYGVWSGEAAGTVLLLLAGGLGAIIAGFLAFQDRLQRVQTAAAAEGASVEASPDDEPYLPHASIWPFELGIGMTLALTGLVLGWAVLLVGAVVSVHALGGWITQSRQRSG
jgi:hypothetical protein